MDDSKTLFEIFNDNEEKLLPYLEEISAKRSAKLGEGSPALMRGAEGLARVRGALTDARGYPRWHGEACGLQQK